MGVLCDVLTVSRLGFALAIVLLSVFFGRGSLGAMVVLLLCAWTTDVLDGRIARRINKPKTWVGEREAFFDIILHSSVMLYFAFSRFFPNYLFLPWFGIAVLAIIFRIRRQNVSILLQSALGTSNSLSIVYFASSRDLIFFFIWLCLALIFNWLRFKTLAKSFLSALRLSNIQPR